MGLIQGLFTSLFGGGRNVVAETVEVFRENAEAGAARSADYQARALEQFAAEFMVERKGWFDRFMDGLNRVPRPALALGTIGLFVSALVHPMWFAARMQGIALVPQPLWWLMGAIVSFYFGARHQVKGQDFQRSIAASAALVPQVQANMAALKALEAGAGRPPELEADLSPNPALQDWSEDRGR
ncbi:holin family protein [Vannielia sp.]|uniref:holin family protein n=1 Tax=Vannielia sp. TaxID=2813045 RepID=UPI00260EC5EC|nr:holin family protein [Vannielia sp.]MDF1871535.1 holin family protein [Vannielia sp.]